MRLFSRSRRLNGSAQAAQSAAPQLPADDALQLDGTIPPAAAHADATRVAVPTVSSLRDGLQQLYSIRPSRDAFAEEAVKLIAKSAGVRGAALLGYEQRGGRLQLLGHAGLDAEAVQILGGESMVSAWDIPLRSLRNRRINVIEAAHENPFVPKPLVAISPRRLTIAALPFFHANAPIGVVVLFSPTPRGFADGLLKALSQSLRVCALALAELPAAGAAAPRREEENPTGAQPNLLRGLAALKAELARLADALEESERQRATETAERVTAQSFLRAAQERSAQFEQELAELRASGERLPAIEEHVQDLSRRLAAASEAADAARSQVAQLQTAIAQSEQRAACDSSTIAELTSLRTQLEQQMQSALDGARQRGEETAALQAQVADLTPRAARAAELETALAATDAAKSDTEAVVASLRQELRTAQDDQARTESALAQSASALAASESERATTATQLGNAQARLAEQVEANGRLAAERAELLTRIETLAAGGESLERDRNVAVNAARQRVAELEAEIARLAAALDAARDHGAEEINRTRHDAAATLDGLRVDLAEAVRARDELQRGLGAAQQELASHQRALAEMSAERAHLAADAERAHAERSALTTQVDTATAEHAALQRARDEAAARIAALENELRTAREQDLTGLETQLAGERESRRLSEEAFAAAESGYQQEIAELRDRLAAFDQEQNRLAKELEAKELLLQSAEKNLTGAIDLAVETTDEDSVLDIDRDHAPESAIGSTELDVIIDADAAAGGECILLDGEDIGGAAVRQLAEFGHRVSTVTPTPETPDALKERTVACAALNLAAPNAWAMLRHLRNGCGIPRMPLIAYALAANAPKGFWLGPVDFAILPVAQTDLVETISRLVPTVKRVLAMSNDIDVMSDVRTQLSNARISTAVVLDGRQALDLVPTIRPEAAVLHLSPTCADVFRAIAGLRSTEISRHIPIVFLLDAEAQPREEAFLTAGLRMLTGRGDLVPNGLVDSLASAFEVYRVGREA
jgi:predicted  nucleic acid-binding Zn-ribbon protein